MKDMTCEQRKLLRKVSEYEFMIIDIVLYLDTHPDCPKGMALYRVNQSLYLKYLAEYERKYGALSNYRVNCDKNWTWDNSPWPWEMEAN